MYVVIGLPPSSDGVVHVKDTDLNPGSADNPIGCVGNPCVFADTIAQYGPAPAAFTAATLKSYNVPDCNPVTTYEGEREKDAAIDIGGMFHELVPLIRYSIKYDVIGMPPLYNGGSHVRDTLCNPGWATRLIGALGTPYVEAVAIPLYGPVPTALMQL